MESYTLKGQKKFLLKAGMPDHIVKNGDVHVVLQPFCNNKPIRRMYLGTAKAGELIPAPFNAFEIDNSEEKITCLLILEAKKRAAVIESFLPEKEPTETRQENTDVSIFELSKHAGFFEQPDSADAFWGMIWEKYQNTALEKLDAIKHREKERQASKEKVWRTMASTFQSTFAFRISNPEKWDGGLYDAAAFLCKCRRIRIVPYEKLKKDCENIEQVELSDISRLSGFTVREAELPVKWYRTTETAFFAFIHEGESIKEAVIFPRFGRFMIFDPKSGEISPLRKGDYKKLDSRVLFFDRPFTGNSVKMKEVIPFAIKEVSLADIIIFLMSMLLLSLVGVAISALTESIYDDIIPRQEEALAYGIGSIFLATLVANFLFLIAKNLTDYRIGIKAGNAVQIAIFHRVFHLPEQFFRGKESAEQAYRITQLSNTYINVLRNGLDITVGFLFSLVYLRRMYKCSVALAHIGLGLAVAGIIMTFVFGILKRKTSRKRMRHTAKIRSYLYQALNGIGTIRMAGAEDAILGQYMEKEGALQENQGNMDRLQRTNTLLIAILNAVSMLLMYWIMGSGKAGSVSLGAFMGFISANTMFSSSIVQATGSLSSVIMMLPLLKDTGELMMTHPESGAEGKVLKDFRGDIKISHVSFGYKGSEKKVLQNVSLHIHPGEYVGIVGHSGCGKSTLIRLLLGFEKPDSGQIFYDDVPVNRINLPELRRRLGAVLQDGSLMSGSILQNIRIVFPDATSESVERTVEAVGLTQEIAAMPMGLMTHVSDEALTLSGGQKQRILIARAILGSPKLLLFDEATSSLDNIAQEKISNALASYDATRIVVAHRLSTVRLCDRILVMDNGKIIESGSYDELMKRKGNFYEMVKIQQTVPV